ncbi:MAG: hypothetical protein ACYTJ0_19830 [Planctomycetota bacterium]|jgi:hypothetical protein
MTTRRAARDEPDHAADAWIFARLAEASAELPAPAGLVDRIERRLQEQRQRRLRRALAGLAAAAVMVLAALGWMLLPRGPGAADTSRTLAEADRPPAPTAGARVTFDPQSPLFGRPIESDDPRVTIVMVYRSVRSAASANDTKPKRGNES